MAKKDDPFAGLERPSLFGKTGAAPRIVGGHSPPPGEKPAPPKIDSGVRRRGQETGEPILVRLQADVVVALDAKRGNMTRPEAIRIALDQWLKKES